MDDKTDRERAVVVLGAGAPHSPLMAGALCAIWEGGKTFDIVYTAGAGGLIGMLLVAPHGGDPVAALRSVVDIGVADEIYRYFPVNYKVFYKPGPFTQLFRHWARMCHIPESEGSHHRDHHHHHRHHPHHPHHPFWPPDWPSLTDRWRNLYNDWIDLWFSALTPTTLSYFSEGMCAPIPFLDDIVDWNALKHFHGDFFLNAYNITQDRVEQFDKHDITPRHVQAALAYPFIYPPVPIGPDLYYEGADRQPLPHEHFKKIPHHRHIGIVVIMDILGCLQPDLVRRPRNLWDAYNVSIVTPIVSLAQQEIKTFKKFLDDDLKLEVPNLVHVTLEFPIPVSEGPDVLHWSRSNMQRLWDIGHETGKRFVEGEYGQKLPPHGVY